MQILISGSLAYDRIMDFPDRFSNHILPEKIHILNVVFTVTDLEERFGGTAGNIAYGLTQFKAEPLILATSGTDFGRYEARLIDQGLSLTGIRAIPNELTAGAYITTDQADNQITAFNPGAMKYPSLYELDGKDNHRKLMIVAPGNLEDMQVYCRRCRELGIKYVFDPGQSITSFSGDQLLDMLSGSYVTISNDYELSMIMSATGLSRDELLKRTGNLITTLGEEGSLIITSEEEKKIPAAKASRVLDPTGAGDAYRAGLIQGLIKNKSLVEAARMGAVAASYAVEKVGTQEYSFDLKEYWARYETSFGPCDER